MHHEGHEDRQLGHEGHDEVGGLLLHEGRGGQLAHHTFVLILQGLLLEMLLDGELLLLEDRGAVLHGSHVEGRCGDLNENRGSVLHEDLSEDRRLNHGDLCLEKIQRKSLIMVLIG